MTARPKAASASSRQCAFGGYFHRHRHVAERARAAIDQTTGPGAGTIRAMSTAELPAGEMVSPSASCACLRLQVPLHASSQRVDVSRCTPLPRAPASAHCAHMRPLTPPISCVEARRALCDHHVLPMRSVGRHVDTCPMTRRWRGAGVPPVHIAHRHCRRAYAPPRTQAHAPFDCGRDVRTRQVGRRRQYRHGPPAGPRAIPDADRSVPTPWPASASLRWSIPALEAIIARPISTVSPCVLPRHPYFAPLTARALLWAVLAMGAVVLLSNILVQYPIND